MSQSEWRTPGGWRNHTWRNGIKGSSRLMRYGVAGLCSLLVHLLVLVALVESGLAAPVPASVAGFAASVAVSFILQHRWVFRSSAPLAASFGRFLVVVVIGLLLNVLIMSAGVNGLGLYYPLVQMVAFAAVPVSNYLFNRAWTFRAKESSAPGWPAADMLLLCAMSALVVLLGFYSILHLDLARDLNMAAAMVADHSWLLKGPELAGSMHLGPAWYWLLALLQFLGLEVAGSAAAVACLASLQFWLVWRAGCEWHGPNTGLLAAVLLAVPSWSLYQFVLMTHPVLLGTCLAATLLAGIRFAKTGRGSQLVLTALFFSLAVHAHPASLVLAAMPLGLAVLGWSRSGLSLYTLVLAAVAGLLPFAPVMIDALQSAELFSGLGDYLGQEQSRGSLSAVLPLAWALSGGGLKYWLVQILEWPQWLAWVLAVSYTLALVLGLVGSAVRVRQGDRISLVMLITVASGLPGLAMIRAFYPYYMVSGAGFCLVVLAAGGLGSWLERRHAKRMFSAVAAAVVLMVLTVPAAAVTVGYQRLAEWPFATMPVFNVIARPALHQPHPFLSVRGAADSASWLCSHDHAVVHGAYAVSLIHSYGIEGRLHCELNRLRVGGQHRGQEHWLGLALPMLEKLKLPADERVGGFGLVRVERVLTPAPALRPGDHQEYPPLPANFGTPVVRRHNVNAGAHEWLVLTDMTFGVARPAEVVVHCGEKTISPVASDRMVRVYDGARCNSHLVFRIESALAEYITLTAVKKVGVASGLEQPP